MDEVILKTEENKNNSNKDNLVYGIKTLQTDSSNYFKKGGSLLSATAIQSDNFSVKLSKDKTILLRLIVKLITIFIFICLIGAGFYYFVLLNKEKKDNIPVFVLPKPIITPNENYEIKFSNLNEKIKEVLSFSTSKDEKLLYIPIISETNGLKRVVSAKEFVDRLSLNIPEDVIDNLDDNFMYSFYRSSENYPILLFKIKSFDYIFPALLKWEKTIFNDLGYVLKLNNTQKNIDSVFYDKEIDNHDVRILDNSEGVPVLYYSIFNRKYLIITINKNALTEIFKRLSSSFYLND